ncbi:hypothetical protein BDZ97DRAFT_822956 [Flammula alnicola]|nr:hypothetical protein BDZ97DRAFT_822956 [Flammula alnicola]
MKYLIEKLSGQFIYASTVIKYIDSPRHNPAKRLKIILGLSSPGKDYPFAQLDALYRLILSSVEDVHEVLEILTLLVLQQGYSNVLTVQLVEAVLSYDDGDLVTALTDMHALVHVPLPGDHDRDGRLQIYHASLHDFLMDKSRSEDFFVDAKMGHANLARHFLLKHQSRKFDDLHTERLY